MRMEHLLYLLLLHSICHRFIRWDWQTWTMERQKNKGFIVQYVRFKAFLSWLLQLLQMVNPCFWFACHADAVRVLRRRLVVFNIFLLIPWKCYKWQWFDFISRCCTLVHLSQTQKMNPLEMHKTLENIPIIKKMAMEVLNLSNIAKTISWGRFSDVSI